MIRRALAIVVLLSVAQTAEAKKKKHPLLHEGLGDGWFFVLPMKARLGVGYVDGVSYRDETGVGTDLMLAARPELRLRTTAVRLALELAYSHRETFGYSLRERRFETALLTSARLGAGFRAGARASLLFLSRPGWADHYQGLEETDRYSHLDLGGEASLGWRGSRAFEVDLHGGYQDRRYAIDPAYDRVLSPTHVAPFTSRVILGGVEAQGRAFSIYRWLLGAEVESIQYRYLYARDAGTGLTHSGPGGLPSNPLQHFVLLTVRERNRIWIEAIRTHVRVGLLYRHNEDTFADYYTWNSAGGEASLRVLPIGRLAIEAAYEIEGRLYVEDGYQAGDGHPPLQEGTLRRAIFHRATLRLEYGFWRKRVLPFIEGEYRSFVTNFPDELSPVGIDYRNLTMVGGVELAL